MEQPYIRRVSSSQLWSLTALNTMLRYGKYLTFAACLSVVSYTSFKQCAFSWQTCRRDGATYVAGRVRNIILQRTNPVALSLPLDDCRGRNSLYKPARRYSRLFYRVKGHRIVSPWDRF
jgi:hypothetical protein